MRPMSRSDVAAPATTVAGTASNVITAHGRLGSSAAGRRRWTPSDRASTTATSAPHGTSNKVDDAAVQHDVGAAPQDAFV